MPPEETSAETQPETKKTNKKAKAESGGADERAAASPRLAGTGRNDACPCGSGKKYKKCHLIGDEAATAPIPEAPDPRQKLATAWGLIAPRRPGAAEKEFRAAQELEPTLPAARVRIGKA